MENKEVILSVKDLNVKFSLRGKVLHAIRGISLDLYTSLAFWTRTVGWIPAKYFITVATPNIPLTLQS